MTEKLSPEAEKIREGITAILNQLKGFSRGQALLALSGAFKSVAHDTIRVRSMKVETAVLLRTLVKDHHESLNGLWKRYYKQDLLGD